ncbi:MipA/OmpV family protein [Rubellimicrobium arenae]|uniref:MipA/OmpV family protein n=1 Tax=Rubellimicrobium arenae TaxID=2817372 RepID=UPI001B302F75|nr:MipA/OmpV family protein [Rubellimicrobium arenae]
MLRTLVLLAALAPLPALAQSYPPSGGNRVALTLGVGVAAVPDYFGSDEAVPEFDFRVIAPYLRFGRFSVGREDPTARPEGFGFRGSFRYIPERSSEDHDELAGLPDVDRTFELGGGLSYAQRNWETFAVARYGFGGHEAWVGELGLNVIAQPTERLTLRAGPRVLIGSGDYADAYFSVPEATPSLAAYDADGGVLSSGLEAVATYQLTDVWGLRARVRYERLMNDAADSPITGEDDQITASLLVTRRFSLDF